MSENGKLRILATAFDYRPRLGGVATLNYELHRAMAKLPGVEVRVIAPQLPESEEFDRNSEFKIIRGAFPSRASSAVLPLSLSLGQQIRTWKPHAILNTLWLPEGASSLLCAPLRLWAGIPYFLFAHGVEVVEASTTFKKRLRRSFSPLKKAVFRGAALTFTVSDFTRGLLVENCGLERSEIVIAHPGVDPAEFRPAPPAPDLVTKYGLEGKKVFMTVTRLLDYKGVDRAIAAVSQVRKKHPEIRYLICGEGPDRPRLESLVRHYGVGENVHFVGKVPAGRLRDFYNLADAFVLLSREDWDKPNLEGFGIVFIEAGACAKPSIGGRSGGISDAVGGEEFGWLVDPLHADGAAQAMTEVIEKPELARKKGEASRNRALQSFTWTGMAETVVGQIRGKIGSHVRN